MSHEYLFDEFVVHNSRRLQSDAPTPAPSVTGSGEPAPAPTSGGDLIPTASPGIFTRPPTRGGNATLPIGAGWLGIILGVVVAVFLAWCLYGYCRRKREQRMLDMRSQQAERVLGDMQMVPNEDLDNELL